MTGRARRLSSVTRAVGWVLGIAWRTNPALTVGFLLLAVLRSVAPAGIALVARGLINAAILAAGQSGHDLSILAPWLAAGLVLGAIEALAPFGLQFCRPRLADDLNLEVMPVVLRHATELEAAALEDPLHRETIDWVQHEAEAIFIRFITELEFLVTGVLQTVLLGAVLVHLEPLVLIVVAPLGLPYAYVQWRRTLREHGRELARQRKRRWTRYVASLLTGPRFLVETRVLGIAPHLLEQYRALMTRLRDEHRALLRHAFVQGSTFGLFTTLGLYAAFVLVAARAVQGTLTVGDIAVFAAASPRLRAALERTILAVHAVMEEGLRVERILRFLRIEPRIVSGSGIPPSPARGELTLQDVWFTYPTAPRAVLCGVSLTLRPGEIVGLVGPNGAGKTTLVKLIARLYDPDRGRILLDGMDLRAWPLPELRRRIALVGQDVPRFEATAADNVALGDWPRAARNREDIEKAAAGAGADAMIRLLPKGYDTPLGPSFGEHDLSGGQWQKIALARAFVRDAPILVLDEPTAHLDAGGLHELHRRLRDLAQGRTTLVISHRPETVAIADRIVALQHGRIVSMKAPDVPFRSKR